jgi:hypothetical protein
VETRVLSVDPHGRAGQILVLLYNVAASTANRCVPQTHDPLLLLTVCSLPFAVCSLFPALYSANAAHPPPPALFPQLDADAVCLGAYASQRAGGNVTHRTGPLAPRCAGLTP